MIFSCGCNELIKVIPLRLLKFWWSLIHILLMITASVISFIALDKLSRTITVDGQDVKSQDVKVIVLRVKTPKLSLLVQGGDTCRAKQRQVNLKRTSLANEFSRPENLKEIRKTCLFWHQNFAMTHDDVIIFGKLKLKKNSKTNNCKKDFLIPLNPTKDINTRGYNV